MTGSRRAAGEPLVSVILAVREVGEYLPGCLDSILGPDLPGCVPGLRDAGAGEQCQGDGPPGAGRAS